MRTKHRCVMPHIRIKGKIWPSIDFFYRPFLGGAILWILFVSRLSLLYCLDLFLAVLWLPTGKGLTSWLSCVMFPYVFVTSQHGVSGEVRYLLVSITVLCLLCLQDFS